MDKFKRVIAECGMSDEEVARLLDVGRKTVTRWRRGKTHPHEDMIDILVEKIVAGSDNMTKEDLQLYVNHSKEIEEKLRERSPNGMAPDC